MPHDFTIFLRHVIGWPDPGPHLGWMEMTCRGIAGFVALMVLIRIGRRRLMGRIGPFDLVVTLLLGSTLSRGITGNAPFLPVLTTCAGIVLTHWTVSFVSSRSQIFSRWMQGRAILLAQDGTPDARTMRRHVISENDLAEAMRLEGKVQNLAHVGAAYLERSGNISILPAKGGP